MAFYTFITEECKDHGKKYGKKEEIEAIAKKIERDQSINNLQVYGPYFLGKPIGRDYRLIIGIRYHSDDTILVLWRLFSKSEKDYEKFCSRPDEYRTHLEEEIKEINFDEYLRNKKANPEIKPLPQLSNEEKDYLFENKRNQDNYNSGNDFNIIESENWVEKIKREELKKYGAKIHDAIFDLCDNIDKNHNLQNRSEYDFGEIKIIYKYLNKENQNVLFLIEPFVNNLSYKKNLPENYCQIITSPMPEGIERLAYRAYPVDVVWDKEIWLNYIEYSDEKANMALSEEEIQILNSVKQDGYPLFINGRPGSGKSTVIQYLFAEHLFYYLNKKPKLHPPLYLTYSNELLSLAKEVVKNILKCNAKKVEKTKDIDESILNEIIDKSFVSFRVFMKGLLDDAIKYPDEKYIDFPRFKRMFEEKHFKKISPEIAWHVIRTYIKGFTAEKDDYLTPEDYERLPRKRKTVDQSTYKEIYDKVWERWYREKNNEGYWDDQDLARNILMAFEENNCSDISKYPAVFCDEAQDFTHNELRLIYRLSLYSKRTLKQDYIKWIPFAFAGDPFQTLSPTGFDWEATKANFHEIIIQQLTHHTQTIRSNVPMNWKELDFNYRSNKSIVQLCNLIHLIRGVIFRKKQLRPQRAYFEHPANIPVYYELEEPICKSKMRDQKEIVIIIPCQEGEEVEYVKQDPFLSEIAFNKERNEITRNILSPIRAKGLEFKRIVLYKFGEEAIRNHNGLFDLLDVRIEGEKIDSEKGIPLEYFINRLYVGASRAISRLIIVDTQEGINNFWKKYFENTKYIDSLIDRYKELDKNSVWSKDDIAILRPGDESVWETDQDSPEDLAEQFFKQGYAQRDTYKLLIAKDNYQRARKDDKALECQAYIYEIEEKRKEAGEIYVQLKKWDKALEHYWQGKCWESIIKHDMWEGSSEFKAADFMIKIKEYRLEDKIKLLDSLTNDLKDGRLKLNPTWDYVISKLVESINDNKDHLSKPKYEWDKVLSNIQEFQKRGILSNSTEVINNIKLRTLTYPENIEVLYNSDLVKMLYDEYFINETINLDERQSYFVLSAILKLGEVERGFKFLKKYLHEKNIARFISYLISERDFRLNEYLFKLFNLLTENDRWELSYDLVTSSLIPAEPEDLKKIKEYQWGTTLDSAFIRCIALSDLIIYQDNRVKNKISNYLREKLILQSSTFQGIVTAYEAGAALEKAGMVKYCLEFYELVIEQNKSNAWKVRIEDEINFAKLRWLKCKLKNYDLAKSETRRRGVMREFKDKLIGWGLEENYIKELPDFPVIEYKEKHNDEIHEDPVTEHVEKFHVPTIQLEMNLMIDENKYKLELIKDKNKLRIINNNTNDLITLLGRTFQLKADDNEIEKTIKEKKESEEKVYYYVTCWNMSFVIRRLGDEMLVDICYGNFEELNKRVILTIAL